MKPEHPDFSRLSPSLALWQKYDAKVKADLSSTAITLNEGVFLIDPIALPETDLDTLFGGKEIAGVVVTNANHLRAAPEYAARFSVPIHAGPEAMVPGAMSIKDGDRLGEALRVTMIEGAAPGEVALYSERDGGTLIVGDALINFGAHGFTLLPAKYCSQPRLLPGSLRRLLAFGFERILFAHGLPIVTNAHARLAALLS